MSKRKWGKVNAGEYRDVRTGKRVEPPPAGVDPELIICRRVADYAPHPVPPAAAFADCALCAAPIAYNPAHRHAHRPKVCMQCAGIVPLPIES